MAAVVQASPMLKLEILPDVDTLATRLREPMDPIGLLVIQAVDRGHLQQLSQRCKSLHKVRIALLLPDTDKDTVALAHTLHPSLMTYSENSLHELTAVLRKLANLEEESCAEHPGCAPVREEVRTRESNEINRSAGHVRERGDWS